jgi:hypothetical protein
MIKDATIRKYKQEVRALRAAVQWMSGSTDFAPGGKAHEGWLKILPLAYPDAKRRRAA